MVTAPIFAVLMALWPGLSFLGTLGYTPLLLLCTVATLPFIRLSEKPRPYAIFAAAFIAWTTISWSWSPANTDPFISGSLTGGDFAIQASWMRLVGMTLCAFLFLSAILRIPQGQPKRASLFIIAMFGLHSLTVLPMPLVLQHLLDLFYDDPQERAYNGIPNALRNVNAFALALPVLIAWAWQRGRQARLIAGAVSILSMVTFVALGAQTAILSLICMALAIAIVRTMPKHGFRVLFSFLGASILVVPFFLINLARYMSNAGIELFPSAQARAWAWSDLSARLAEKPVTGHGLEATETWTYTYSARPEWLKEMIARGGDPDLWSNAQVIPGHPHNMALEIWVETGLIGAILAALAVASLGWRLPSPRQMATPLWMATAGLAGAAFTVFSFSYSAWNEAFWAGLILISAAAILVARAQRPELLPVQSLPL